MGSAMRATGPNAHLVDLDLRTNGNPLMKRDQVRVGNWEGPSLARLLFGVTRDLPGMHG